jgi:signal transduction histidine kinase/PAS domain-containing protein
MSMQREDPPDVAAKRKTLGNAESRGRRSEVRVGHLLAVIGSLLSQGYGVLRKALWRGSHLIQYTWRMVLRWFDMNTLTPEWLPRPFRAPALCYLWAVLLQAILMVLNVWFITHFDSFVFQGMLSMFGIMLAALILGAGPSMVATLAATALLYYFALPPRLTWTLGDPADNVGILMVLVVGSVVSIIAGQGHQARQRVERLASQLEVTFETMVSGVIVYDTEGHPLRLNTAARAMFGMDAYAAYLSLSLDERTDLLRLRDEYGRPLPSDQRAPQRVVRGATLLGPTATDVLVHTLDEREVQLNVTGAPLRDAEGQITGGVCIFQDVTERRALERRTRDALNALLAVAETLVLAPEGAGVAAEQPPAAAVVGAPAPVASGGAIVRIAELMASALGCARVGVLAVEPETEALRPAAAAGISPTWNQQWWTIPQAGMRMDDFPYPDLTERLRAGEVLILDLMKPPLNEEPNLLGVKQLAVAPMRVGEQLVGIMMLDYGEAEHHYTSEELAVTEAVAQLGALVIERERLLREREEARANELAMRVANRRMDEFLGIASHELKTPLTSIQGYIQLLARRLNDPRLTLTEPENVERLITMVRMVVERSEHSIGRISRLVDDLLDDSRIREGRLEFRLEPCDLAALVQEAVEEHRMLAPDRTIELELPTGRDVPVMADASRIRQVVANYLTNALKYSREHQPVAVRLDVEGSVARVAVRDEGVGLPLAEQAHVWDRFYRAKGVAIQSGSGVGMGIGLYICRSIIEGHHGQVGVESAPEQGSTFWFTVPLACSHG